MKTIWSTRGNIDKILDLPVDQKRLELTNWYDQEMVDQLADDELDQIISDNADVFYDEAMEDFEYNIVPMISNQFLGGFVLDENFNLVDPGVLLNDAREDCEIYEDNNGDLYWKEEGRKAFPLLGFAEEQDRFIDQLDQLDILSTMHNLYPGQDDEDIEVYDIADLIPFDWALLENVLNHATNELDVVEELTEAKAKNPNKLSNELAEVVDLANEYGYEYFTQMPFTSYDNDPIAIETQYPEFFRVIKSFFKEMELLDDATKEDYINDRYPHGDAPITKDDVTLDNPDVLDYLWDLEDQLSTTSPSDFKHDWDVIIRSCEKLANGKGVQFEKEYKTGYNSALDDDEIIASREQEESLKEDFIEVTTYDQAKDLGSGTKWIWSGNYPGHEDEGEYYFNKYKNLGKMFIDPENKLCKIVTDNRTFIYDKDDKVLKESLNESVEIHMEGTYDMADLLDAYDEKTGKVHDNLEFIKDLGENKHLYKDDEGIEFIVTDEGVYDDLDEPRILPADADDEDWEDDLDESAATDKGRQIASKNFGWIHKELFRLSDAVDQLNKRKSLKPDEKEAAKAIIDVANDIRKDLITQDSDLVEEKSSLDDELAYANEQRDHWWEIYVNSNTDGNYDREALKNYFDFKEKAEKLEKKVRIKNDPLMSRSYSELRDLLKKVNSETYGDFSYKVRIPSDISKNKIIDILRDNFNSDEDIVKALDTGELNIKEESLTEDTVTWPWGDPENDLPNKALEVKDTSDIDQFL